MVAAVLISLYLIVLHDLEHPGKLQLTDYNERQCNHCSRKEDDDTFDLIEHKSRKELRYTERLEEDHTYVGLKGSYPLRAQSVPAVRTVQIVILLLLQTVARERH